MAVSKEDTTLSENDLLRVLPQKDITGTIIDGHCIVNE